ncbi:MAG: hypothetical protein R3E79_03580 [Caldilineaceae bacterium]
MLDTPRCRQHGAAHDLFVVDQPIVGADDAIEAVVAAQQISDNALAKAKAYLFI